MFAHLHVRSWFSFLAGGSPPAALAAAAAALGHGALALTDVDGVYGVVRHQRACRAHGLRPIVGAEVTVEGAPLVLLARDAAGYANLCRLLTHAHAADRLAPSADRAALLVHAEGLFCLTGTLESTLWRHVDAGETASALRWLAVLREGFGDRLSIEVAHHLRPGSRARVRALAALGERSGVALVATGDVRYAGRDDYRRYDLLRCIGAGQSVFEPGPHRPRNAEAFLKSAAAIDHLLRLPAALERAAEIAAACDVDLLPGFVTPPEAELPEGTTARAHLRALCRDGLRRRYPRAAWERAGAVARKELGVIEELGLEEYFLVVHEVVRAARGMGIRCAGRGSAANSIVAYLLGITNVDPVAHNLLFERFLHGGRRGTPDIDIDFDAERRGEVIAWMEDRFGHAHTAMTATLTTYRLRSAVRDVAKALGWSAEEATALSKRLPRRGARHIDAHRELVRARLGDTPLTDVLIDAVRSLDGCPRHLGLHAGGMVLSRTPLHHFAPVRASANGVTMIPFDKHDVEALGLIKLDVLGLRMLASLSEADELVARHEGGYAGGADLDALPLDDVPTFNLIRASETIGVFQIESQGQIHLLAQHQPDTFRDLVTEIALFRPGPLQGGMVHPFVRRRRGLEPVRYDHPDLEPILRDTYGVILFQEQVLDVAHRFAGLPLEEADEFRRLMSKFRDPGEMEGMRARFVGGAAGRGVPEATAQKVFDAVAHFVGYGFCRSHAAAFAHTVYQSAYLKRHHPAAFLAAVMQHRPGMYDLQTLEEEARRRGVTVLLPEINRSGLRYDLERDARGRLAIRKPLTAVRAVSAEAARRVVWAQLEAPFTSVRDVVARTGLDRDALRGLARSGALDALAGDSRRALWEAEALLRSRARRGPEAPSLFPADEGVDLDVPELPPLTEHDRLVWDYETHGAARRHPMTLVRRSLQELEVRPIRMLYRLGRAFDVRPGRGRGGVAATVAGIVTLRQQPPTANGVLFVTLEDETGSVQCVVPPAVQPPLAHVLGGHALIVRGRVEVQGNWRGLVVQGAWRLDRVFGGYEGHPSADGGRDRRIVRVRGEEG